MWTICEDTKPPSPKLAPPSAAARVRQPLRRSSTKAPTAPAPSVSASARTQAVEMRQEGEQQGARQQSVRVRSREQRGSGPEVGVVDGQVAVGDDLARQHRERVVLHEVVAGEQRIAGEGGDREHDERDARASAATAEGVPLAEQAARWSGLSEARTVVTGRAPRDVDLGPSTVRR